MAQGKAGEPLPRSVSSSSFIGGIGEAPWAER